MCSNCSVRGLVSQLMFKYQLELKQKLCYIITPSRQWVVVVGSYHGKYNGVRTVILVLSLYHIA